MMIVSLEKQAYSHIREKLRHGMLRPGEALREAALGKEIGVSRTPVRHAIRQLEREGLVAQVPGFGSYVKKPDPREFREIAELRMFVERGAAAYAAERITQEQLKELGGVCDEMLAIAHAFREAASDLPAGGGGEAFDAALIERNARADTRFHEIIVTASGNERMAKLVRDMGLISRMLTTVDLTPRIGLVKWVARKYREHSRIYRAIRARDARLAASRMEEHLRLAAELIVAWAQEQER